MTTAIIATGGLGSVIACRLASGGGVDQSSRLEVGGDLHDLVVTPTQARPLIGRA